MALIAIDGVSIDQLDRRLGQGLLPSMAALVETGELHPLTSPVPAGSFAAWPSLASGVMPDRHGIFLPDTAWPGGIRPAGRDDWRAAPVWERLAEVGIATASLGWPCSKPGSAWAGCHIDSRFGLASGLTRNDWPLPLDVAPASLREDLREARTHPTEIHPTMITPLLGDPIDAEPQLMARAGAALARAASMQAGLDLLLEQPWSALFVFNDWISRAAAALGVRAASLPEPAWILLDAMVGAVAAVAAPEMAVMLASISSDGPGFLIASGRDFQPGQRGPAVSSLALVPSILKHFGWIDPALGWSIQEPARGLKAAPADPRMNRVNDKVTPERDLARLANFGLALPPLEPSWRTRRLIAEAEILLPSAPKRAMALANQALAEDPASISALGIVATALIEDGDAEQMTTIADRMAAIDPDHLWHHLARAAACAVAGDERGARPHLTVVERRGNIEERVRAGALWLMLGRRTIAARLFDGILKASPNHLGALLGLLATDTVRGLEAEALLRRVLVLDPEHREARAALASLLRSVGRARA